MGTDKRCLICQRPVTESSEHYHRDCSRSLFGTPDAPDFSCDRRELVKAALPMVARRAAVQGFQEKLIVSDRSEEFLLKPASSRFPRLPENEALTMLTARSCGIDTVPSGLIRNSDGTLAYITRRIDRQSGKAIHMEDFCQILERLTEDKYKGSIEQIGKALYRFSSQPVLDIVKLLEITVFTFITGNADMHLKNFSILHEPHIHLAPAYDLLNTRLVLPESVDPDESALAVHGKRRRLTREDFCSCARTLRLNAKQTDTIFAKFSRQMPAVFAHIDSSFLPVEMKAAYTEIAAERAQRLDLEYYTR